MDAKTKKISGIDADIISEIANCLGVNKVDVRETSFSDLFGKLNADNSIDMAVGGIFITHDGEKQVAFTEPLYKETETVIVLKFSNLNFKSDLKVKEII
ncbi:MULTISPECIES: transporter substrate-binding domain-containing protein [unclassified Clostridium]|uniref:transporter substrate-binding domain-containing protein n=1 Tax=unclassified Clostridium TaxID=2614128 RepID=UPI00029802C3|nr:MULTISPECIES: transporter substrate-binding domain-containing protein [unclassified Clostridium]EKQ51318.1 MAG: periplasmic component of amino acid ABC-type transporter/signal transduction system [Clostridium sp. Maddingley MBC34-26]